MFNISVRKSLFLVACIYIEITVVVHTCRGVSLAAMIPKMGLSNSYNMAILVKENVYIQNNLKKFCS